MTFASPWALLLLLGLPLLLFLERMRLLRSQRPVASAALWRGLLRKPEERSGGALASLDLPAGLRGAAFLLGAVGVAGPSLPGAGPGTLRILLDRSASMGAEAGEGRSRLSLAVEKALHGLEAFPGDTRVVLERPPLDPGPVSTDLATARRLLSEAEPTDAPLDLRTHLAPVAPGQEVLLVTDGVPPDLPPDVRVLAVGPPADNAGFVAFEAEGAGAGEIGLWGLLRNFSARGLEREIVATGAAEVSLGRVSLGPGEARALSARVGPAPVVGLRCLGTDALRADDAVLASAAGASLRVRVGPGVPGPVLRALAAQRGLALEQGPKGVSGGSADLEVGARGEGSARFRFALDLLRGEPFEATGVRFLSPLPEEIDLSGVRVGPVRIGPEEERPLILARTPEGEERPIAVEDDRGWVLHFDPSAGNWKDHPSFPVFFAVAAQRARERSGRVGFVRSGDPLPELPGGAARVGVLERPGRPPLCVNLLSPEESSLAGGTAEPVLRPPRGGRGKGLAPVAFLLAAGGVGVSLLLEARRG